MLDLALEDARVHGAQHLVGGGRDGAVAEGLERQDRKGLLDLDADLVVVYAGGMLHVYMTHAHACCTFGI
jgi:hypothetical protein